MARKVKEFAPWIPAAVVVLSVGAAVIWKVHEDGARRDKVLRACFHATVLAQVGLVEEAQHAWTRIATEKRDPQCPDVGAQLRAIRAQRTEWFEQGRSLRRAAQFARRGVPAKRVSAWRKKAFRAYLQGLALDPASPGARAGLRALLRNGRPRRPPHVREHCERARALLRVRLQREARAESVRASAAGRPCPADIAAARRGRRSVAYSWLRDGEARERADDRDGARRDYVAALAVDPGLDDALAGLDRMRPDIPEPASLADVAKLPALASLAAFLLVVGATVAFVLVATALRFGRRRRPPRLDILSTAPLSEFQYDAVQHARVFLATPQPGGRRPIPSEFQPVTGIPAAPSPALTAVPVLERLNAILRFGRWIAERPRASISVAPVNNDALSVSPWRDPDGRPRGRAVDVDASGPGGVSARNLGDRLGDAILDQRRLV